MGRNYSIHCRFFLDHRIYVGDHRVRIELCRDLLEEHELVESLQLLLHWSAKQRRLIQDKEKKDRTPGERVKLRSSMDERLLLFNESFKLQI